MKIYEQWESWTLCATKTKGTHRGGKGMTPVTKASEVKVMLKKQKEKKRYSEHLSVQHSCALSHIGILRASSGFCSGRPNPAHSSVDDHHNYSRSSYRYVSYGIYILRYHCCRRLRHPRVWVEERSTSFLLQCLTSKVVWPLLWHLDITHSILSNKVIMLSVLEVFRGSCTARTLSTRSIWAFRTANTSILGVFQSYILQGTPV